MSTNSKLKLISHLTTTISIYADDLNYILIIRSNPKQSLKNGRHQYFRSLADLFDELFEHQLIAALGDDRNKTIPEMVEVINHTRKGLKELIRPFEERSPA